MVELVAPDRSNVALLAALRERDPSAAASLYDRFSDRVNALVWQLLGADAEHSDVVQQVFINVIESVRRLRDAAALGSFVTSVAVNTVRKELRRRRYRSIVHFHAEPPERAGTHAGAKDSVFVERFYAVLTTLDINDRIALVLHHLEGYTIVEVAAACDCSLATVKRRIARAKQAVMEHAERDPVLAMRLVEAPDDQ